MGRTYLFDCPKCGYKAKVSGRADEGRDFSVQTISCSNCKRLHDAVTRLRVPAEPRLKLQPEMLLGRWRKGRKVQEPPPSFETALNQMPRRTRRTEWLEYNLFCPVSSIHKVKAWNNPGRCPLCGVYLERSPLPFRIWE